jgi:hypothetical protein
MSDEREKKTTRRGLLSLFTPERRQPGFSLNAFYAKRAKGGVADAPLPHIPIRPGLPVIATTDVGVPERSPLHREEPPLPPLPAELEDPDDVS